MLRKIKNKLESIIRGIRQSPINYATLGFKDPELNKKYEMNLQHLSCQSAKGYMAFLALMILILTPLMWQTKYRKIGCFCMILIGPTFIITGILYLLARIRQSFIFIILPLNVLVRGLLVILLSD